MSKSCENVQKENCSAKKIAMAGMGLATVYAVYKASVFVYQHINELKDFFQKEPAEADSDITESDFVDGLDDWS